MARNIPMDEMKSQTDLAIASGERNMSGCGNQWQWGLLESLGLLLKQQEQPNQLTHVLCTIQQAQPMGSTA